MMKKIVEETKVLDEMQVEKPLKAHSPTFNEYLDIISAFTRWASIDLKEIEEIKISHKSFVAMQLDNPVLENLFKQMHIISSNNFNKEVSFRLDTVTFIYYLK